MKRKTVFRLFSRLNVGGPSLHVVNLSAGLESYGFDTTLIVGALGEGEGSMAYYATEKGVTPEVLPSFGPSISPWRDLVTFLKLLRLFILHRPEIVHTHTFKAGLLGRLAAALTFRPHIFHTYHGHLLTGYRGKAAIRVLTMLEWFLALFTDRLICVSEQVAQDLIHAGVAPKDKFVTVELGFDVPALLQRLEAPPRLREELGISRDAEVVGMVCRLVPVKSVELTLAAMAPMLRSNPKLHLVIVGDGPERAKLEAIAATMSPQRVHFCGWRENVVRDLPDFDVCVCSSRNEGTSVSIIEAVIAGVPVVSTAVGGMRDLLGQGQWGILVAYDEEALRNGIARALRTRNPQELSNISEIFRDRFSDARLVRDTAQLYAEALGEKDSYAQHT